MDMVDMQLYDSWVRRGGTTANLACAIVAENYPNSKAKRDAALDILSSGRSLYRGNRRLGQARVRKCASGGSFEDSLARLYPRAPTSIVRTLRKPRLVTGEVALVGPASILRKCFLPNALQFVQKLVL
jgi:hypothetical protein